jgi:hypothetical protein
VKSIAFTSPRIAIAVDSTHPQRGQASFAIRPENPQIQFVITDQADNERKEPVQLTFDDELMKLTTMEEIDEQFLTNRHFFDHHAPQFPSRRPLVFGKSRIPRSHHGYIIGTIVRQVQVGDAPPIRGNKLVEPGFGTLLFGVMILDAISIRISMARIKMGSDTGADVSFSGVETNGIWK